MASERRTGSTGASDGAVKRPGRFRRALYRFAADEEVLAAEELQSGLEKVGATAVAACPMRQAVCVAGTIRGVMLRPLAGTPSLEAELYDGSGSVTLIWLGRRRIAGIEPGRSVVVRGRISQGSDRPVIYNPIYELRPTGA